MLFVPTNWSATTAQKTRTSAAALSCPTHWHQIAINLLQDCFVLLRSDERLINEGALLVGGCVGDFDYLIRGLLRERWSV